MKVKYIGPHDEVELPDGQNVKRNHQVDVSDDLAGHPPEDRLAEAYAELAVEGFDHYARVRLQHEITTLDWGSGLLAQSDAWRPVESKKADKKDEATT